ncbi:unnamed protein product, partial [Ceratitis capitata]
MSFDNSPLDLSPEDASNTKSSPNTGLSTSSGVTSSYNFGLVTGQKMHSFSNSTSLVCASRLNASSGFVGARMMESDINSPYGVSGIIVHQVMMSAHQILQSYILLLCVCARC